MLFKFEVYETNSFQILSQKVSITFTDVLARFYVNKTRKVASFINSKL